MVFDFSEFGLVIDDDNLFETEGFEPFFDTTKEFGYGLDSWCVNMNGGFVENRIANLWSLVIAYGDLTVGLEADPLAFSQGVPETLADLFHENLVAAGSVVIDAELL